MPSNIMSSYRVFSEKFKVPEDDERTAALKRYFDRGGVISAVKGNGPWPRLVYPSVPRVEDQLKELDELKKHFESKRSDWKKKLSSARSYHSRHQVKKFSEPLYWQHIAKSLADSDYRDDVKKVGLPVHLVADPKWKPMVRMFVSNLEYRKNLVETVQTSVVYSKEKRVARYADVLQGFRSEMSESKLGEIDRKLSQLNHDIASLELMKKWAKG